MVNISDFTKSEAELILQGVVCLYMHLNEKSRGEARGIVGKVLGRYPELEENKRMLVKLVREIVGEE